MEDGGSSSNGGIVAQKQMQTNNHEDHAEGMAVSETTNEAVSQMLTPQARNTRTSKAETQSDQAAASLATYSAAANSPMHKQPTGDGNASTDPVSVTNSFAATTRQKIESRRKAMQPEYSIGYNPQDSTSLKANGKLAPWQQQKKRKSAAQGDGTTDNDSTVAEPSAKPFRPRKPDSKRWRRRKGGRYSRIVTLDSNEDDSSTPASQRAQSDQQQSNQPKQEQRQRQSFPPLPNTQYRVTIRRRAIRKLEDGETPSQHQQPKKEQSGGARSRTDQINNGEDAKEDEEDEDEVYGDTSLGMKLIVVGGKVIVQHLNALVDGRASPAQLVGIIQRADVLLSVNGFSLVDLPIDQLMEGLKPLSATDSDGAYPRTIDLRFEVGVGTDLLKTHEQNQQASNSSKRPSGTDPANEMFSLFPLLDQPNATASADDSGEQDAANRPAVSTSLSDGKAGSKVDAGSTVDPLRGPAPSGKAKSKTGKAASPDSAAFGNGTNTAIAKILAQTHQRDRQLYTSEFFSWDDDAWEWLRLQMVAVTGEPLQTAMTDDMLTPAERIERGMKALLLFNKISYSIEETDKGKDMRSFKLWNSSLSLRSGASRRRRHVFDSVSLPAHKMSERFDRNPIEESDEDDDDDSLNSHGSGSDEEVDGDELLLGLAAHDEIWKKQVLETLKNAVDEMESGRDEIVEEEKVEGPQDMNAVISNELGAFLFGEKISKVIKKKKTHALPPDEVTSVLFDLTTNVATSAPDEITITGQQSAAPSVQSSVGFHALSSQQRKSQDAEVLLATQFLLEHSLPIWLKSFRPLPWEHRRVLWPRVKLPGGSSHVGAGATTFSDDSLTLDSGETGRSPAALAKKSLQERIEDQELDVEARAEACFLVTFYFTQKLLPACSEHAQSILPKEAEGAITECVTFIQKYGSYLHMQASLSYAASIRAERIIDELLRLALNDIGHKDASKEIQRANTLTFYNSAKLSAVVSALGDIPFELRVERRNALINLSVTAYPDVQPWQVRKACRVETQRSKTGTTTDDVDDDSKQNPAEEVKSDKKQVSAEDLKGLFYAYLSELLDPMNGHSHARRDLKLVEEFCNLSVEKADDGKLDKGRLQNFFAIASKSSSTHLAYKRDLIMLLNIAMNINKQNLALDLATETIESRDPKTKSREVLQHLAATLRTLYHQALEQGRAANRRTESFKMLARIIKLYQRMDRLEQPKDAGPIVNVPRELHRILELWQADLPEQADSCHPRMIELIRFLGDEVDPNNMLRALALWSDTHDVGSSLYSLLQALLRTGSRLSLEKELSGSLLRLKYERVRYNAPTDQTPVPSQPASLEVTTTPANSEKQLWALMSAGNLTLDK